MFHFRSPLVRWISLCAVAAVVFLAVWMFGQSRGDRSNATNPAAAPQDTQESAQTPPRAFQDLEALARDLPRDSFDPQAVVDKVGRDPLALYRWVRDETVLVPYQGSLRGPVGVLMDRMGNSMDRALLLSDLLRLAGYETRLARGSLNEEALARLWTSIKNPPRARQQDVAAAMRNFRAAVDLPEEAGNPALNKEIDDIHQQGERSAAEILQTIDKRLAKISGFLMKPRGEEVSAAPAALREHWWVQMRKQDSWFDLDPVPGIEQPGTSFAEATQTLLFDDLDSGLFHQVEVKVIVERAHEGSLDEQVALEHTIRPQDLFGQRLALSIIPVNWQRNESRGESQSIDDLKAAALAAKEWLPVLEIGTLQIAQFSFTDSGEIHEDPTQSFLGKSGLGADVLGSELTGGSELGETSSSGWLSAVWLQFEIRVPGRDPQRFRRELVDILGPSARASRQHIAASVGEELRLERSLKLLNQVAILPLVCDLSPAFLTDLFTRALLEYWTARRDSPAGTGQASEARVARAIDVLTSVSGPLYGFALGRKTFCRSRLDRFLDQPNLLCFVTRLKPGAEGRVARQEIFDIVNNSVGVRPGSEASAYRVRFEQGITDTVIEGTVLPHGDIRESTVDLLAIAEESAQGLVVVRTPGDENWQKLEVGDDTRIRMEEDLRAGYVVLAPKRPLNLNGRLRSAWWRVQPDSGEILGVMDTGFHSDLAEYSKTLVTTSKNFYRNTMSILCPLMLNFARCLTWALMDTNIFLGATSQHRWGWVYHLAYLNVLIKASCL